MRTSVPILRLALLAALAACGDDKKGPTEPPPPPNDPPTIEVPQSLAGTSPNYSLTLPVAETESLTFTASDPENALLLWQLVVDGDAATATGMSFTAPVVGNVFELELAAVVAPAAASITLLVEDTRGGAAAIDLHLVRSGPPTITGVEPSSAFATRTQPVRISGTALELGGAADTLASFDGIAGTDTVIESETSLTSNTPANSAVGPTIVAVANQFGAASLPAAAFTMHTFPPVFFATDTRLDAGASTRLELARNDNSVHAVWLEGSAVTHRVSTDRGATWSTPQPLSGVEAATEPQVVVDGDDVTVAWIGDNTSVWLRRSGDNGVTFEPAQRVDAPSPVTTVQRPRLAVSGDNRYVAWLSGNSGLGTARVLAAGSTNGGVAFSSPLAVDDGGANQANHEIACDGATAWLLCEDNRPPGTGGALVVRTINTGSSWQPGTRLNSVSTIASQVRLAVDGNRVFAAWVQNGGLWLVSSSNRGLNWSASLVELQGPQTGVVSSPRVTAGEGRVQFTYVVGGTVVRLARFDALASSVQQTTIGTASSIAAEPCITANGNYVFVAWRDGDVGAGTARVNYSVSVDSGSTFELATGLGNGTAAQEAPRLVVAGANILLGWIDSRDPTTGVFVNRTAQ
jgi:predicted small lipoprotein YifL